MTYVLYIPWLLSLSIAFLIKFFYLGKDKDLKIGNIRFTFLGGKLALHDVQYASKNVYVRVVVAHTHTHTHTRTHTHTHTHTRTHTHTQLLIKIYKYKSQQ